MTDASSNQIRNLLSVMLGGVVFACLLIFLMIHYYGPSGRYEVSSALLSPEVIPTLNYNDYDSRTGGESRFVFNHIELSYRNEAGVWQRKVVDMENYAALYEVIRHDKSILDVSDDVENLFKRGDVTTLFLLVHTESNAAWQALTKTFQEVQFIPGQSYYRIDLHEANTSGRWVYFQHNRIYDKAMELL